MAYDEHSFGRAGRCGAHKQSCQENVGHTCLCDNEIHESDVELSIRVGNDGLPWGVG